MTTGQSLNTTTIIVHITVTVDLAAKIDFH